MGVKFFQKTMFGCMISRESTCHQTQTLCRGRAETTANERIRRGFLQQKTSSPEASRTLQVVTETVNPISATKQTLVQEVTFNPMRGSPTVEPSFNYFCSSKIIISFANEKSLDLRLAM